MLFVEPVVLQRDGIGDRPRPNRPPGLSPAPATLRSGRPLIQLAPVAHAMRGSYLAFHVQEPALVFSPKLVPRLEILWPSLLKNMAKKGRIDTKRQCCQQTDIIADSVAHVISETKPGVKRDYRRYCPP